MHARTARRFSMTAPPAPRSPRVVAAPLLRFPGAGSKADVAAWPPRRWGFR
jgi:hypothetical protein